MMGLPREMILEIIKNYPRNRVVQDLGPVSKDFFKGAAGAAHNKLPIFKHDDIASVEAKVKNNDIEESDQEKTKSILETCKFLRIKEITTLISDIVIGNQKFSLNDSRKG